MFKATAKKLVVKLFASLAISYNFLQVFSTVAHALLVYQCNFAINKSKNSPEILKSGIVKVP